MKTKGSFLRIIFSGLCLVLAGGLMLILVMSLSQAQGPEPGVQSQGPTGASDFSLDNQQMGFVSASQSHGDLEGGRDNLASDQGSNVAVQPAGVSGITARPEGVISYQGQLLQNGSPLDGSTSMTFSLYSDETGGSAWWQEMQTVQVDGGFFNVTLGTVNSLQAEAVDFQSQQWLGIQPQGASSELTPRQPLGGVGYAFNLMPGATLVDENPAGGYVYSLWVRSVNHNGIFARSNVGPGLDAQTFYTGTAAVRGTGYGVDGHGVVGRGYGDASFCPSGSTECASGIYGAAPGDAYASFFYGENRSGIIDIVGDNTFYGLWVDSTIAPDGRGIWTDGESYFADYVTFAAGKSGYVVDIALNDGNAPLEKGDVVVISGYDAPVVGNVPVVRVTRASAASATGVIGVVDVLYVPCDRPQESLQLGQACGGFEPSVTTIQPGQYLAVVTLGAYEAIKVDASSGPIRPGDPLTASPSTGYAMSATPLTLEGITFYAPGTIIGKALGSLDQGTGVIPVFISPQ